MIDNMPRDSRAPGRPLSSLAGADITVPQLEGIPVGPQTWVAAVPLLIVLLRDGNSAGQGYAIEQLNRMAQVADMSVAAVGALGEFATTDAASCERVSQDPGPAAPRDERTGDLFEEVEASAACQTESGDGASTLRYGWLALQQGGKRLPLEVLYCAAGFYLGTLLEGAPYSRESQYFRRREEAAAALRDGTWIQYEKPSPLAG